MKKIMAVILALVLSLTVLAIPALAASKQIVWSFHEAGHTGQEGWSEYAMTHDPQGNSDTVYDADNGMVKVVVSEGKTSDTMYLSFSAEEYIDPATHKFVKFRMDGDFEYEFNINLWLRENQTWNINDLGNIGEFFGKDTVLNRSHLLFYYNIISYIFLKYNTWENILPKEKAVLTFAAPLAFFYFSFTLYVGLPKASPLPARMSRATSILPILAVPIRRLFI